MTRTDVCEAVQRSIPGLATDPANVRIVAIGAEDQVRLLVLSVDQCVDEQLLRRLEEQLERLRSNAGFTNTQLAILPKGLHLHLFGDNGTLLADTRNTEGR